MINKSILLNMYIESVKGYFVFQLQSSIYAEFVQTYLLTKLGI